MNTKQKNVAVILIALIALIALLSQWDGEEKTPAQIHRENIISHFSPLDGSNYEFIDAVKNQMHNPNSFEHIETRYKESDSSDLILVMKFRGTNGFGGVVTNTAGCKYSMLTKEVSNVLIQ